MSRTVLIAVSGILTGLNDIGWTRTFTTRFKGEAPARRTGCPYVYYTGPIGGMDKKTAEFMADQIAELIVKANSHGHVVDVAGHSHAGVLIPLALKRHPEAKVRRMTLAGAAAKRNCRENHLDEIAARLQAEEILILWSPNDFVLKRFGGLEGYGDLGLRGPEAVSPKLAGILMPLDRTVYTGDHNDYFNAVNCDRTYRLMTGGGP